MAVFGGVVHGKKGERQQASGFKAEWLERLTCLKRRASAE